MKKYLLSAAVIAMLFSCQNDITETTSAEASVVARRGCASDEVLKKQLAADPTLALRMNKIEQITNEAIASGRLVNGKIVIPVVVNVLYRTTAENISLAQIQSQIDILNRDFNASNSDFNQVPSAFSAVKANIGISFELSAVLIEKQQQKPLGVLIML